MSILAAVRAFAARVGETLRRAIGGKARDGELDEEMAAHLEMHTADNIRRGMPPDAARRDALLAAGGLTLAAEAVRERRGLVVVEDLARDVRHVVRSLARQPGYVLAVVLTLALGIGANAAMFTVVDSVVLHPLPYPAPDRLLSISEAAKDGDRGVVDDRLLGAWIPAAHSITAAVYGGMASVIVTSAGPEDVQGVYATPGYFEILGVRPLAGRTFVARDTAAGAPRVVIVSQQLAERSGIHGPVVGRTITLDDQPTIVVGVMPASFTTSHGSQYWTPKRLAASENGTTFYWQVIARLRDGATIDGARAELATLGADVLRQSRYVRDEVRPVVMTLAERWFGERRKPLLLLFAAVGVLLLIACANLANLALVRAGTRQRETVVRLALGAGRRRIVRALLVESFLLASAGGALGVALSLAIVRYVVHMRPDVVGQLETAHVNAGVLLFTAALTMVSGMAFGLAPAVFGSRGDLARGLSTGTPRASATTRQHAVRRVLVAAQLALALVLLTGAGVVARSFWRVTSIDLGFQPRGLLAITVRLPQSMYTEARVTPYFDELAARVGHVHGVRAIAFADVAPLSGASGSFVTHDSSGHEIGPIFMARVGPGYFEAIGTRLISGRGFRDEDAAGPPRVVLSASIARRLFPGGDAIGKTMPGPGGRSTIIGVVDDVRPSLEEGTKPLLYPDVARDGLSPWTSVLVRLDTESDLDAVDQEIAHSIRGIDPRLPPPVVTRLDDVVSDAVAPRAFVFALLSSFAAVAALLAIIGLYGVLSRVVTERTREIGIRVALGAEPRGVIRTLLSEGLAVAAVGAVLGLGVSVALMHLMRSLVYQTNVYDPWTFLMSGVLMIAVSLIASYVPARRATRIDPVIALRHE